MRNKEFKISKWESIFEILRQNSINIKYHYIGKKIPRVIIDEVGEKTFPVSEKGQEVAELELLNRLIDVSSQEFLES